MNNKYKTFEELKEELGNNYDLFMYEINLQLLIKIDKAVEYIEKEKSNYMRSCDISNATNREGLIISSAVRTCDDTLKILRGNDE